MFWRFGGYANISSLDSLLDKPDVTIEEILDESDTLGELKGQNAKLIDFLRNDDILEKLLNYVIAPPKPAASSSSVTSTPEKPGGGLFKLGKGRSKSRGAQDDEREQAEKQRMKYAYISAEILSSDVWSISEAMLESADLLRPFWDFLKTDAPMDNLQAGYFTKINEALIEKQPARMVSFVRTLDDMIPNMMKHVDCPMIMDLLLKLISLEKDPGGQGIVDWIQTQRLIPILLSYIGPDHPASTQTAAGDFLKAIITISANATGTDQTVIGPNELTRELVSPECIESLLDEMLKGGNSLTVGVGIVIEVIRKNNSDYDAENQFGPEPKSSDPIYLGNLLRQFAHAVPKFMDILKSPKHTVTTEKGGKSVNRSDLKTAWGKKIEPLGFDRFKTCELMAELLHCSNMALLNERGAEAEILKCDTEREKLKAAGKLTSVLQEQGGEEFGRSVDSSGFHHAEAFSPLGESPEKIKQFDAHMQGSNDEDEFEKVALDEADTPMDDYDEKTHQQTDTTSSEQEVSGKMDDLNLDDTEMTNSHDTNPEPSEPISHNPATEALAQDIATPAPLFARRNTSEPVSDAPSPFTQANINLGIQPASSAEEPQPHEEAEETGPGIQREDDGTPVLGDLLKMQFVEHGVVPTILDFFFRFPWNNFLHNVVYDVVQQVFNGAMDRGYNRNVATDLFVSGRVTERVIEGQEMSDQSQKENKMRLGYMGHLTLIAEEIVKFTERQAPETLDSAILDKIMSPTWIQYVEQTLSETRERDNAILGGVRPDPTGGPRQAVLNSLAAQNSFANAGSQALANAGLTANNTAAPLDSMDLASAGAAPGYNLSGFGSSDEDDEEDERDLLERHGRPTMGELTAEPDSEEQIDLDLDPSDAPVETSEESTLPAPLAVPASGSQARHRLAAILSEKKRQAELNPAAELEDNTVHTDELSQSPIAEGRPSPLRTRSGRIVHKQRRQVSFGDELAEDETTNTTNSTSHRYGGDAAVAGMAGNSGFADDFKGFDVDEENLKDDDDLEADDEDDDGHVDILATLRKMSARPTSVGDTGNSSDASSATHHEHAGQPPEEDHVPAIHLETVDEDTSSGTDLLRVGEAPGSRRSLRGAGTFDEDDNPEILHSSHSPLPSPQPAEVEAAAADAAASTGTHDTKASAGDHDQELARRKKEEQQRLLQEWGLAGDDSSEDEENLPVEMGKKSAAKSGEGKAE